MTVKCNWKSEPSCIMVFCHVIFRETYVRTYDFPMFQNLHHEKLFYLFILGFQISNEKEKTKNSYGVVSLSILSYTKYFK